MKIDVNERKENALLEREEIALSIDHTGEPTPSVNAVRTQLAAELDLDPLTVQVDHIYSPAGAARSTARVTVFEEPIMDELPEEDEESEAGEMEGAAEETDVDEEEEDQEEEGAEEDDDSADADEDDSEPEADADERGETDEEDADREDEG